MKGRVWLTVFLLLFVCLASTAFAEQVVEVWRSPLAGLEGLAANAGDGSVWVIQAGGARVARLGGDLQEIVQVQGFAGANAIAANSADGSCWVGDYVFGQVVHLAADGTELSRTGGILEPGGLSVDPADGSCWVADLACDSERSVVHLAANGTELSRRDFSGLTGAIAAVPGTNSCWLAECYYGDEVHHLQDNLDGSTTILSSAGDFSDIRSISVDTGDGTLWVSDCSGGQVVRLQEEPDYDITILSTTPLNAPRSLSAVPGAGVWVVEYCGGGHSSEQPYVLHLDADGNVDATVTDLRRPFLVSADGSDQSCWVLGSGEIAHLAVAGDTLQRAPSFVEPRSVAANPNDGSSWVADPDAGRVVHVTADGDVVVFEEGFMAPFLVAVNPTDGSVWVVDSYNNEVVHLAADGSELFRSSDLCCPVALAVDPNDGSCWVADNGWYWESCGVVQLSAEDGSVLFGDCQPYPNALAVDPNDSSLWVGTGLEYYAPAGLARNNGWITHYAGNPDEELEVISDTPVPAPANCLAVDPTDSSCLAALGEGLPLQPDALAGRSPVARATLDGDSFTVPVLRITETPSGPAMAALGAFWNPMGVSVNPADRSIWVADGFAVGHMAADGTVLSRTTGYCCVASLSVDTGDGSCWIAAPESADVADLAVAPEADFTASADTGVAPFEVSFADLSTGSPTSWAWTFGDGGTSTEQNPTHTYGLGHYTVSLTVEGVGGSDTETKINYIYAGAIAPTADFSATPTTGQAPLTVTFEDLSTNSPTEWLWSFGDGASSDAQNPTHEYQEQGVYTVSLVVTNSQGFDVETKADYVTVQQPLTAAFSTDVTRGASPLGVQFTDESVGGVTSWLWSFGDGDTATAQNPIHYYEDPGFYTVTLLVWKGGVSASVTKTACIAVGFTDTPGDHWALLQEIACAEAGIVQGYWDGSYDPYGLVTRSQMATFIARALAGGDENVPSGPATPTFADVGQDYWAYRYIEYCADQEIVVGYWDDTYHPDDAVDRGQMAVFIARTVAVPTGMEDYTPPATPTFSDVTSTNEWDWCYKYVEYVAALDPPVAVGYPDETYRPQLNVTRDQMAVYMQRAFDLPIPSSTP